MLRGVASTLEKHHRVQLLDEALEAAVRLSHRYIPARQLPDKAVSLLDTACARVAISQHATPAEVEDCRAAHRGARDRARDHRPRGSGRHRRRRAPQERASEKLAASEQRALASSRSAGRPRRSWSTASWRFARSCAQGSEPVEGTGSELEQAAEAQKRPPTRRRRARHAGRTRRRCSPSSHELQDEAGGAAGRVAADPAERRRAGGRVGRRRTGPASRSAAW